MADDDEPSPAGFGIPAIFTNRYMARLEGSMVRLVFGDAIIGKHAKMHTHLVMKLEDYRELGEMIRKSAADFDKTR